MLDGSGVEITSREEFAEIVRRAAARRPARRRARDRRPRQPRRARRVRGDAGRLWRPRGLRQRIEHAQLPRARTTSPRFAALGVAASVQFSHAPSDRDLADGSGPARPSGAYAYRSLLATRARCSPTAPTRPSRSSTRWRASRRRPRTLDDRPPWHPEQARDGRRGAARRRTVNPAWLAGDERRRGRLAPGYLADLVVLDRDPLASRPRSWPRWRWWRRWSAGAGCSASPFL